MHAKRSKNLSSSTDANINKSLLLTSLLSLAISASVPVQAASLLNVDFGAGPINASPKVGSAAVGQTGDFWNFYSRGNLPADWQANGALINLRQADFNLTSVGLTVIDARGAWGNGSLDPMYDSYLYPLPNGPNPLTITLTNLPVGKFDIYLYSQNGNYQLLSGGVNYGVRTSYDLGPNGTTPVWEQGVQYALFQGVGVMNSGEPVTIVARPGIGDVAQIAGLQVVFVPEPAVGSMVIGALLLRIWQRRRRA